MIELRVEESVDAVLMIMAEVDGMLMYGVNRFIGS